MKKALYNIIGTNYNSTRCADPTITERLYQLLSAEQGNLYLDIGCGTGNYTLALSDKGLNLYGVDPSEIMIQTAQSRNQTIQWKLGTAENIPSESSMFDGIIGTLTLHHWKNLQKGFKELYRVLKNGGKAVFFTSTPEQMNYYWLNYYFPEMLERSILQMPSLEVITDAAFKAGFGGIETEKFYVRDNLQDHFLYVGKNTPALYFNKAIQNGISSFSSLAHNEEIKLGLSKLKSDMDAGLFLDIKSQYDNDLGDYLFVIVGK